MEQANILQLAAQWVQMTRTAFALKRIPSAEVQSLFKATYEVLYVYHKESLVPKEISRLLLEMDGFLSFAAMIGDKDFDDNPYLYQAVHSVAEALKEGFLDGTYASAYPVLTVYDAEDRPRVLDLENGYVEDLI